MLRSKWLFMVTAGMLIVFTAEAQYNNTWFRTTLSYPLNEKIRLDGEFQHRRQSGWDNRNPVDQSLMFTLRNWVHYQHSRDLQFSVSPFTYFYHYRMIENKPDENVKSGREYRVSAAVDWQTLLYERLFLISRSAVEYRMLKGNPVHVTRLRTRFGLRYDVGQHLKIGLYDELFVNASGTARDHLYDHNRIAATVAYRLSCGCKLETGYLYVDRLLPYNNYTTTENNIFLNLSWTLPKVGRQTKKETPLP